MASVNGFRLIVQLVSVPLLARLLSPEDYGLAAMAMPIILFVMMLSDAGLGMSLVRIDKSDSAWHTCFWVSVALGIVVAIGLVLVAPAIGFLLNQPRLTLIIIVLAVIVPTQTLALVPGAALQQQKRFGTIAINEMIAIITSIGTAVFCAYHEFGVWSLIWQNIVFYVTRLILTLTFSPYRPCLIFNKKEAREHLIFGRNLLGANLIGMASRSVESLVIGRVQGTAPLGIFTMAFQFARIPFMVVTGPLQYVLYPHMAPLRNDRLKLAALYLLITRVLAIVILPAFGLVAVASEPIFHLLLSEKWGQAAPIFVLIAPATALQPVTALMATCLLALGRTDVQLRLSSQMAGVWLVGLTLSVWFGIEAVAAAYSICAFFFACWSLRICLPLVGCTFTNYAMTFRVPIVLTIVAIGLYEILKMPVISHGLMDVGLAASLAAAATIIGLMVQRQHIVSELLTLPTSNETMLETPFN